MSSRVRLFLLATPLAAAILAALLGIGTHARLDRDGDGHGAEVEDADGDGGPRPDGPAEYLEWRKQSWRDEDGVIAPNGLLAAKAQADTMRRLRRPVSLAGIGRGTWTSIGPANIGGRIRSLLIDPHAPDVMLAGAVAGGVWRTTDGGASWAPIDDFMANLAVTTLAAAPGPLTVIYAGTGESFNGDGIVGAGIFKSVDGGLTWTQLPATATAFAAGQRAFDYQYINRLAVSPNGATVLAATLTGLFRSTDGGATWTKPGLGVPQQAVSDVDFSPSDPLRAVAGTRAGGVLVSSDAGATWTPATGLPGIVNGVAPRVETAFAPSNGAVVFASVDLDGGSLYRSSNGGQSFVEVFDGATDMTLNPLGGQGWYDNMLFISPTDETFVVWGGINLYRSTTSGVTFTRISSGSTPGGAGTTSAHPDQHVAVAHPGFNGTTNRIVYIGNDGGIYRADDVATAGSNPPFYTNGWSGLNRGLGVTQFYGGAGHAGSGRITGGTQDNGTLLFDPARPTPAAAWSMPFGGDGGFSAYDPTDANTFYGEYIYLSVHRNSSGGGLSSEYIYGLHPDPSKRLTDAGNSTEAEFIAAFTLDPNEPNTFLGAARRLWRSTDVKSPAPAWEVIKPVPTSATGERITAIAVAPGHSEVIYVADGAGRVYRTVNGTAAAAVVSTSWTTLDDNQGINPLPNRRVTRLTVDPLDPGTVYAAFGGFTINNLWKSTDFGVTWHPASGAGLTGLPPAPVRDVEVHPLMTDWLYAGTEIGIFTSEDGGDTWSLPHDGPSNAPVDELFFMGTDLVAVTHGRGMFKTPTTLAPEVGPPTGLEVVSVAERRVTLRWTPPIGGLTPTAYELRAGARPGDVLGALRLSGTDPVFTFDAPASGLFFVRLHTVAGAAISGPSNEVPLLVQVAVPPSAPVALLGVVNGDELGLSWRNTFGGGEPTGLVLDITGSAAASVPLGLTDTFRFAGVPPGTYVFSLRATNTAGASAPSGSVTLTFPGPCSGVPPPPADVLATTSGRVLTVRWSPPTSGPAATSYAMHVASSAFTGTVPVNGTVVSGAVPAGTYSIAVAAVNTCGTSSAPAAVVVTVR